ncbi:MAG: hypothetical protein WC371_02370 [Parachlamydiales bacterium]|jgi:hypothetical protein
MLKFLRTHQKLFFVITTAAVVVTFCFFGTYSTFEDSHKKPERKLALALNGQEILESEVLALAYFLELDADLSENRGFLLKEGVLAKDFLKTGLARLLADKYYKELAPALENSFRQALQYKTYEHPEAAFLSQKKVYEQFYPEMLSLLDQLKSERKFSLRSFDLLTRLYLAEEQFSPSMVRRILLYQQSQNSEIKPDPYLFQNELFLFGFREIKDWFSRDFIELAAQFIWNTAARAEEKGFKVTSKEVKESLNALVLENLKKVSSKAAPAGSDLYKTQLRLIGMDEKLLIKNWQKILLFRKYLKATRSSVVIDPLLFQELSGFTREKKQAAVYSLPADLNLKSLNEYALLRAYLKAVAGKEELDLDLKFKTPQEVEKITPELVFNRFQVELKGVDINDLTLKIGEKKLWEWQVQKANFEKLQKEFSQLEGKLETSEKRFQKLEALPLPLRSKADLFSRQEMVRADLALIKEGLRASKTEVLQLNIPSRGGSRVLKGLGNDKLLAVLKAAAEEKEAAAEKLAFLTEDGRFYYSIKVLAPMQKQIFTFAEALTESGLAEIVNEILQKKWEKSELKDFSFFSIKNDFLKTLYLKRGEKETEFLQNYLGAYLAKIKAQLLKGADEKLYLAGEEKAFEDQFKLKKELKTFSRSSNESWQKKLLFDLKKIEGYSDISKDKLSFLKVLKTEKVVDFAGIKNLKRSLENEALLEALEQLLNEMKDKHSLVVPVRNKLEN